MAGGDEMIPGAGGAARVGAALLFIGAGTNVYDAFSAVMSSPWSTEKFTNDSQEAKMGRRYVRHAIVISWLYAIIGAALVRGKLWKYPIAGAAIVTGYMYWLYHEALRRGPTSSGMSAGGSGVQGGTQPHSANGVVDFTRSR